jgi:DNA-binding FadR family transcriptional regulator
MSPQLDKEPFVISDHQNTIAMPPGKKGIHARIVEGLGMKIGSGKLLPGDKLPNDAELNVQFSASRTAVREALKVLTSKGLIEARQRAGTFVRPREDWDLLDPEVLSWLSPETIGDGLYEDLLELRDIVEPAAAGFAARRADEKDFAAIEEAFRRMETSVDNLEAWYAADRDFHLAVLKACHNQFLVRFAGIVRVILSVTLELQKEVRIDVSIGMPAHREVYKCIRDRDRKGAERAMRATIGRGRKTLRERFTNRGRQTA